MKGHAEDGSKLTYKDGDKAGFVLHAMTTDKLILFVSNGRAYTLDVAKLPGGRGHGDPVRLMLDYRTGGRNRRNVRASAGP